MATPADDQLIPAVFSTQVVVFPHMQLTMTMNEKGNAEAILQALRGHHLVAFVPTEMRKTEAGIGTLTLIQKGEVSVDGMRVELKGLWRIRVKTIDGHEGEAMVRFERVEESGDELGIEEGRKLMKRVHAQLDEFGKLIPDLPVEIMEVLRGARDASELADLCSLSPTLTHEEKINLLETIDPDERLKKVNRHFDKQLEALKAIVKIRPIPECDTCLDLADKTFDVDSAARAEVVVEFLNHVVEVHTAELLNVLAEKYGPSFMKKRSLR